MVFTVPTIGKLTRDIPSHCSSDPEALAKTIPQILSKQRVVRVESRSNFSEWGLKVLAWGVESNFVPVAVSHYQPSKKQHQHNETGKYKK